MIDKKYISLIITKKLYYFGPKYNLKQKYNVLIPSCNLRRGYYKGKT